MSSETTTIGGALTVIVHVASRKLIRGNQYAGLYWNNAQGACLPAEKLRCPNIQVHIVRALGAQVLGILNQIQSKSVYLVVEDHIFAYTAS